jgi:exodeoxyribonuclease X
MDLLEINARLVRVIDYETTGTPEDENAEIIEFGCVDVCLDTLCISDGWTSLAKPSGQIPPVTMAVHHITDDDVANAPSPSDLWGEFWGGCGKEDIAAAHNADFEKHFHDGAGRPWICTYKCALVVWPDAPSHGNQALRYWLGIDKSHPDFDTAKAMPPHRALPDAYVTAHILVELLKARTVDELVNISKYPALLRTLRFGKHKGTKFEDAPSDYLSWIRDKSDLDENTKFTASYWLKRRAAGGAQ